MKYWNVDFNKDYINRPGVKPMDNITPETDDKKAVNTVKEFLSDYCRTCCREANDYMKYPYVVPGAVYNDLWDWDSFIMSCAITDEYIEYAKGSIQNLINGNDTESGKPTKKYSTEDTPDNSMHPYPLQAQFAYVIAKRMNDFSWIEPNFEKLKSGVSWFEKNTMKNGLFVWMSLYGNGIDNNPAVYGRGPISSAGIDLAAFHYREYKTMEKLCKIFEPNLKNTYAEKADELLFNIQNRYFDWVDKMFYNVDCYTDYEQITNQNVTWSTFLKFKNCASLFSLWGGVATKEQAGFMRDIIMDENEFLSCAGIRTHSKNDMCYNNVAMGNPSNWQGPVWGLSTFITAYGLARYGYKKEALEVALRLIKTFAADIKKNGCMHECYNGDTGQPLMKPGFVSWNMLACKIIDDIENNRDCTTFDILD